MNMNMKKTTFSFSKQNLRVVAFEGLVADDSGPVI